MNWTTGFRRIALAATIISAVVGGLTLQATAAASGEYTISDGDTLSVIAENNDTTVDALAALNGIDDPDLIFPGEVLSMPDNDESSGWSDTEGGTQNVDWSSDENPSAWVDPPYVDQDTIVSLLTEAAEMYGWDPSLILAQAWQESRWRQDGVSEAGAIGVMQVLPETAASVGDWYLGREVDPWNSVWDNIESGVAYLTILYDETGNVEEALAAYYQGLGSLQRDGMFPDTQDYLDLIFGFQQMILDGDF